MNHIEILNRHKHPHDGSETYIGRPTPLGNPYTHLKVETKGVIRVPTRIQAVALYRDWLASACTHDHKVIVAITQLYNQVNLKLSCYCKPAACHGDVIKDVLISLRIAMEYTQVAQGTSAERHTPKERRKIGYANKAIIQALVGTASKLAAIYEKYARLNVCTYDESDVVFLSSNGNRKGAYLPVNQAGELQGAYKLIDQAIAARACFVADTEEHLSRGNYNVGELLLAGYLQSKGYTRINTLGVGYWLPPTSTTWERHNLNGYECSSKGDKRFSALYATINGQTIEYLYQVKIKGYPSIKEGKGNPPLTNLTPEDTWQCYLGLWRAYFQQNPLLYIELRKTRDGTTFTDCFATTEINQARAISELVNTHI